MYGITVNAHCSSNLTIEREIGGLSFYGEQCRISKKRRVTISRKIVSEEKK